MKKLGIFMAEGCEEIEGLTVVDIVRRAGMQIDMISVSNELKVTGSHNITFMADVTSQQADYESLDGIILPGGMPGTINLGADDTVKKIIKDFSDSKKLVAAICAAPTVLGENHILEGKKATCHPGFEEKLYGADCKEEPVVRDENVITSRGMGTAIEFALEIIRYFEGDETVAQLCKGLVYNYK